MNSPELSVGRSPRQPPEMELLERVSRLLVNSGITRPIDRVEITRRGELEVLLSAGKERQWMTLGDRSIQKMNAAADGRIPLSRHLQDQATAGSLKVLAYRPARRLVVMDTRHAAASVIKGYRKDRGSKAAAKYALAAEALGGSEITVPGPVRFNQLHDYLTMPFVTGPSPRVSADVADEYQTLGKGIRDLQNFTPDEAVLADFTRQDELSVLDERARRLMLANSLLPADWGNLRQRLGRVNTQIPVAAAVSTHRDLHDGQLLLTPDGMALLDFDLMCRAESELDPANFLAHLALRGLQRPDIISENDVDVCSKKFLDGLDLYEQAGFWARLRFYQASSLCRLALVYSLRPKWKFTVPGLIMLGHRCLDDLRRLLP